VTAQQTQTCNVFRAFSFVCCCFIKTESCCVALELVIFLSQPPKFWDCRCVPPCLALAPIGGWVCKMYRAHSTCPTLRYRTTGQFPKSRDALDHVDMSAYSAVWGLEECQYILEEWM
jgi:hypothetical protein